MARLAGGYGTGPEARMVQQLRLMRRVRRRALSDVLLIIGVVAVAAILGRNAHEALLLSLLVSSAGILLFLLRRGRDMGALARADDWRAEAVQGRGLSLSAWRSGEALPGWAERRGFGRDFGQD